MKNGWKRALAVLMTLTMVLALFPVNAWATEVEDAVTVYTDEASAVDAIREKLKQRVPEFTIRTKGFSVSDRDKLLAAAYAHDSDDPTGGDYIYYQNGGTLDINPKVNADGTIDFYYSIYYYTDYEEELRVDAEIRNVFSSLNIDEKDDYAKVRSIYTYICTHVTRDWDNIGYDEYTRQFTACAALLDCVADARGYAVLFYRMALEAGLDARVITGYRGSDIHAWNIVRLGNVYYYLDTANDTWNNSVDIDGCLKTQDDFSGYVPNYDDQLDFVQYTMATTPYVPITGITLSPTTVELRVDETRTLTAKVTPANASEQSVVYSSSAPDIAKVDTDGVVTAVGEGKATITATAGGYSAECTVTVLHAHRLTRHESVPSTCEVNGTIEYWECSCGAKFEDEAEKMPVDDVSAPLDPNNHKLMHHERKEANCKEDGNIEYWKCELCKKLFLDADGIEETTAVQEVNAGKHIGEIELRNVKPASCTEEGYSGDEVYDGCGHIAKKGHSTEKLSHILVKQDAKPATCQAPGTAEYWKCTTCNGLFSDSNGTTPVTEDALPTPVDKDNHTGNTKIVGGKDATCTETGYTGDVVCADCGAVLTKGTTIAKTAHQLTHYAAKTATCKEDGNIEYWKCESCGGLFSDGDGKNAVQAIMAVNKSNHIGGTELRDVKASTCTAEGYTGDSYCLGCDKMIAAGTAVPKAAHELTKHEAVAATHSAAGSIAYWSCAACDGLFSDAAGKQPITAQETVIPATEQKADTEHWAFDGVQHWNVCTDCGAQMNAAAHTFGDWTTQKEATTTAMGVKARACTTCGYREQAEIPTLTTAETVKPSTSQKPESQPKAENQKSPRTADNSSAVIGMTALALAASGVLVTALVRKKRMK